MIKTASKSIYQSLQGPQRVLFTWDAGRSFWVFKWGMHWLNHFRHDPQKRGQTENICGPRLLGQNLSPAFASKVTWGTIYLRPSQIKLSALFLQSVFSDFRMWPDFSLALNEMNVKLTTSLSKKCDSKKGNWYTKFVLELEPTKVFEFIFYSIQQKRLLTLSF